MARSVKPRNAKAAIKVPIRAIAVTGFFSSGARGFSAFRKIPKIIPVRKIGYLEIVFQKFCISFDENGAAVRQVRS